MQALSAAILQMQQAIDKQEFALYSRADSAYHRVILQHAGNRYLEKAYDLTATALEALSRADCSRVRVTSGSARLPSTRKCVT